jgi:hypothetical protein
MHPRLASNLRKVVAVLAGLLGGVAVIMLVEMFGMVAAPPVPDPHAESGGHASVGALSIEELAYVLGSLSAGWVAARLGGGRPMRMAAITGVVLTLGGIVELVMVPHPLWFDVLSTLTFVPMALLGARVAFSRAGAPG